MTPAEELAAVFAEAAGVVAENTHPDTYEVIGFTTTRDPYGGTERTETVRESGHCRLTVSGRMGGERLSGDVVRAQTLYTVALPIATVATTNDELRINGRRFTISDLKRGGEWAMFATAELEEV